jgi:hypothetical protein
MLREIEKLKSALHDKQGLDATEHELLKALQEFHRVAMMHRASLQNSDYEMRSIGRSRNSCPACGRPFEE